MLRVGVQPSAVLTIRTLNIDRCSSGLIHIDLTCSALAASMGSTIAVARCHGWDIAIWRLIIEETVVIRAGESLIKPHLPKVGAFPSTIRVGALEDEKPCVWKMPVPIEMIRQQGGKTKQRKEIIFTPSNHFHSYYSWRHTVFVNRRFVSSATWKKKCSSLQVCITNE